MMKGGVLKLKFRHVPFLLYTGRGGDALQKTGLSRKEAAIIDQ
jgi:hypothetical protein